MAIVFPASPSTNDTFTVGSITYTYDGSKWIGLGVTPTDRLIEGNNNLQINASNNLVWTGFSAQFDGANSPAGRDTRISQYGSLLVATTDDIITSARCSIDAGNGNIATEGGLSVGGAIAGSSVNLQSSATSSWFQSGTSLGGTAYVWAAKDSSANVWHSGLQTDGDLYLGGNLTSANNIGLKGSDGSAFFLGDVGINRTDPDQRLNVSGNIELNAYDSASGAGGYFTSKGLIIGNLYDAGKSYTGSDDRTACIWQERGLDLDFATNDALRMKIKYDGSLVHKGDNLSNADNTDGDSGNSAGYPALGVSLNKNLSVSNSSFFGQGMNMVSHTKAVTLNGSTDHNMIKISNREGCFVGHIYVGYSTGGEGAVAMYKFNTFYSANSITAEQGPSQRSGSHTISAGIISSGDNHIITVNGDGGTYDVTVGIIFLSASAQTDHHYGVQYY